MRKTRPFFGGSVDGAIARAVDAEEDDEDVPELVEEADARVAVAGAAAETDAVDRPQEDVQDRTLRQGDAEVSELRKKCKNTMFVAAVVLSMEGLQQLQ